MSHKSNVRVRFAPSPTGYLHIGGVRTLYFNWLYAKKTNGTLILRVEDTDRARSTAENERMLLEAIRNLGLVADEGPENPGKVGPYRQSERFELYARHGQQLLDQNKAYFCFCSPETLAQKNEAAIKLGRNPIYDGTCANLSQDEVQRRLKAGEKAGLRFRSPRKTYFLRDHVRGEIEFKDGTIGDFLVTRSPLEGETLSAEFKNIGMPVYNFCCVIDDHLMGLTHVIRGEDHLSNSARQLMLYDAFGWTPPEFAHLSLVVGSDRQKLSKRNGDVAVHDYLEKGYLPEAMLNFLVLLGWSPKDYKPKSGHPEIITRDELCEIFNLDGLQKASAVFDLQKLNWMNGFYMRMLPAEQIAAAARPFFEKHGSDAVRAAISKQSAQWFVEMIDSIRGEGSTLKDLPQAAEIFFNDQPQLEPDAAQILKEPASKPVADAFEQGLSSKSGPLTAGEIDELQKAIAQTTGTKGKGLFMPIRAISTGRAHGPELKKVLPLVGREKVLSRIKHLRGQFHA